MKKRHEYTTNQPTNQNTKMKNIADIASAGEQSYITGHYGLGKSKLTETPEMKLESKKDVVGVASHALLAVAPFTPDAYGGMKDADGDMVITCNDECPPCTLYKEKQVDADAWFMCPQCGRLGQRMEEASHRQVLTANAESIHTESKP